MIAQTARFVRWLAFSLALLAFAGCSSQQPVSEVNRPVRIEHQADRVVDVALQQVGVPYRYGGTSPRGFDCSGLVHYSYAQAGLSVPRTTGTLWQELRPVEKAELRVGDVLFFRIAGKMSHVGLYIGGDQFVHAPSTGRFVSVGSLRSDFYNEAFVRAGRPD